MRISPDFRVRLSSGADVELLNVYPGRALSLIFLRHLGCPFCREQVSELREFLDWPLVFVSMGGVDESESFRLRHRSPHSFVCDEGEELYDLFKIARGGIRQVLGGASLKRAMSAAKRGYAVGVPVGDPWRLGGTFIVDTQGELVWEHRNLTATDNVLIRDLELALKRADSKMIAEGEV